MNNIEETEDLTPDGNYDASNITALEGLEACVAALRYVNAQQPTAELRPPAQAQTDEADLMPYDLLEAVEDSAIRDKHTPLEVLQELSPRYPEHTPAQLATWIERFFRLWCQNQWKRERIAPTFHLDDRNVDPRSWCRFPILSGGFERELAELRGVRRAREGGAMTLVAVRVPARGAHGRLRRVRPRRGRPQGAADPAQAGAVPARVGAARRVRPHRRDARRGRARASSRRRPASTDVYLEQLYTFGALDRDPRERVVTVAYYALAKLADHRIRAATDAMGVGWFALDDLPKLAFDHAEIVGHARTSGCAARSATRRSASSCCRRGSR